MNDSANNVTATIAAPADGTEGLLSRFMWQFPAENLTGTATDVRDELITALRTEQGVNQRIRRILGQYPPAALRGPVARDPQIEEIRKRWASVSGLELAEIEDIEYLLSRLDNAEKRVARYLELTAMLADRDTAFAEYRSTRERENALRATVQAIHTVLNIQGTEPDHSGRETVPMSYGTGEYSPEESGMICSECGWLLAGPYAHPDADTQHQEHVQATGR